jgi:predicted RNase H-like nuclease (RuvC/YqgF family)
MIKDDEVTVVTRVGLPQAPAEYKDTYFEQIVTQMATFVDEVRGYRADLQAKEKTDKTNWESVKNEISGVRRDLTKFQKDLRNEVARTTKESEERIKILEATVARLSTTVTRLETQLQRIETAAVDLRERPTLVPPAPKTG